VIDPVVLVADAGRDAGLGHISRSSAVAIALRCRGIETTCYADGIEEPFDRDGIAWNPVDDDKLPVSDADVLVVDSYRRTPAELQAAAQSTRLVVMHDFGVVPEGVALVVSTAEQRSGEYSRRLNGFEYACLRPDFWGLPSRRIGDAVDRVLVTTGSGQFAAVGFEVARTLAQAMPEARVTMVRGPHASTVAAPPAIEILDSPDSLLEPLLAVDLAVTAGGQTMLEAAAAGTPCVALLLVENQRRQAARLAGLGAVRLVDPPDVTAVAATVRELVRDADARPALSRESQRAVDGYGALRVAFQIGRLAAEAA
jgi:UDP-2,4-diacetamido-2,4,6-trideoxy-beta-L-altropyranose hydrolase